MIFKYLKSHNVIISRTKRVHSVNLGTDLSLANHNPAISSSPPPETLENFLSPSRQTKSPDSSNVLHVFNNNTYTNFKNAYKHILIPSYIIWFNRTKMSQNLTLLGYLVKRGQNQHFKLNSQGHILFLSLFFKRNIVSPAGKYPWHEPFKSLCVLIFFFWKPTFQNLGLKVVPQQKGALILWKFSKLNKKEILLSKVLPFTHKDTTLKNRKLGCEFMRQQSLK